MTQHRRFWLPVLLAACSISLPAHSELVPGTMDVRWNAGSSDCVKDPQPPIQVHRYNPQTFILRENLCSTYEAPFIYLLIGADKALLIDTGDVTDAKKMPLRETVLSLLPGAEKKLPLLVVHTHGHLDHRSGDEQFRSLTGVEIVPTDLESVKRRFGLTDWPNGSAQIELGNRTVDVIPTPGHHQSHVAHYDRQTGLFFSGDLLLPGRLLIEDTAADLASARRVAAFVANRPVSYVLGSHIELDQAGRTLVGARYHPNERPLQLTKQDLLALPEIVSGFNGFYCRNGGYVLMNQNRILMLIGFAAIALLAVTFLGLRTLWRRFRRSATRR